MPVAGHEALVMTWGDGETEATEIAVEGRIPVAIDVESLDVAGFLTFKARREGGTAKAVKDDDAVAVRIPGSSNLDGSYFVLTGAQSDALAAMTHMTAILSAAQTNGATLYLVCK